MSKILSEVNKRQRNYITLSFNDIEEAQRLDGASPIATYDDSDDASLFTGDIMGYKGARPWRGFLKLLAASAPIFLAGCILVKCIRKIVD